MFKRAALFLIIIMCAAGFLTAGSGPDLKPGKWEISFTLDMPGMPPGMMPPTAITQCLTKEDMVPKASPASGDCKISNVKTKGNTITWTMDCVNRGSKSRSQGSATYKGTTFTGKMVTVTDNNQMSKVTSNINGRRIGSCK